MDDTFEKFELNEFAKPYNIRHRCFFFSKEIISFVAECKYDRIFSSLFDQLVRSATSIGANIVEGKSGSTKKDWKNFFVIALKSQIKLNIGSVLFETQWKFHNQL